MELTILIPCLNEATTVGESVKQAFEGLASLALSGEVLVADNGSHDGSAEIARRAGARVIRVEQRGYGAALHAGILAAKGEAVLYGDSDLSYDFSRINAFGAFLDGVSPGADLVLGSRLAGSVEPGAMPWVHRYLGTIPFNLLLRLLHGIRTTDCTSGMRLVRRSFYLSLPKETNGMEWATEILIQTKRQGGQYAEVPIHYRRALRPGPSHLRRWRDGWRLLTAILSLPARPSFPRLVT